MNAEKVRILIADDNRLLLAITGDALKAAGFEVFTVNSGLDVYQEVINKKPHIILLDIMMPDIDGIEICKTLKENPVTRKIIIIIFSGKKDMDLMDLCHDAGAEAFLLKSDKIDEMAQRIKEIVREKLIGARP